MWNCLKIRGNTRFFHEDVLIHNDRIFLITFQLMILIIIAGVSHLRCPVCISAPEVSFENWNMFESTKSGGYEVIVW